MILDDLPLAAWAALRPDTPPDNVEVLGPRIWRVGRDVLKLFTEADRPRFRRIVRAHRQAGRIFRGQDGLAAQRLLAFSEEHRALLLDFVPGRSGRMALLAGADPVRILTRSALWLRHLHDSRETSDARFDPWGALERLPDTPACADAEAYEEAMRALRQNADRLQGRPLRRAVLHGDLTLANLLFDDDRVTGIDFENLALHPAARDIGEIWSDLLLNLRRAPEVEGLMLPGWQQAFATPYPALEPEIAGFYTRHRLLRAWSAIPAQPHDRGPGRDRHLTNLRALAANGAFG